MSLLPRPCCICGAREAIGGSSTSLGCDLEDAKDFVPVYTHEAAFASVSFHNAFENTHQTGISRSLDKFGDRVVVLDCSDEGAVIRREPGSKV
jgi:hypothetical protein